MSGLPPIEEHELTPAPLAFQGEQLSPAPFHFNFTGEDYLELATYNAAAGVRIAVQGRTWDPNEGIRPFTYSHVPNTDRSRAIEIFGLANGYLLNCVVFAASGSPRVGQTFVSLHVIRGSGQARVLLATLLQGYVTAEQELAFPGSPIFSSLDIAAVPRIITGTVPAAGAIVSESVPAGARWRIHSVYAVLTTSATVGTRTAYLIVSALGTSAVIPSIATQAGSTQYGYTWGEGLAAQAAASYIFVTCPYLQNLWLPAGGALQVAVAGMQPADQFQAPMITLSELLEAQ